MKKMSDIKYNDLEEGVVREFTRCMGLDDIDGIMKLFTDDSEWIIMATGETFQGKEQIRELASRSVVARNHTSEQGIHPFDVFTNAEGTRLCWELHSYCNRHGRLARFKRQTHPRFRV
jgi:ketosteroid isomerase-like protein